MKDNNTNGDEIVEEEVIISDEEYKSELLDVLLDEDNREAIVLMTEDGEQITFEQVAIIPHEVDGERKVYVILKPLDEMEDINDDEAIVFYIDENEEGDAVLKVEDNDKTIIEVFDRYYKLLEAANGTAE